MSKSNNDKIPDVLILEALRPENAGTGQAVLEYKELPDAVAKYTLSYADRSAAVWSAEPDSIQAGAKARQLAFEYLLRSSLEGVEAERFDSRNLWADRFTNASIELFGQPDPEEVSRLIHNEHQMLSGLLGNPDISQDQVVFLMDQYEAGLLSSAYEERTEDTEAEKLAIQEFGKEMHRRYQPLFNIVDNVGKTEFTPEDLYEVFSAAQLWLIKNDDPMWQDWDIKLADSTIVSILAQQRIVKIGKNREPATLQEVHGLVAHELLVHGMRAKNGGKSGINRFGTGLPGYDDAEEGQGILAEEAINGTLPDKAYDRYLDIALALGVIDGHQRTRREVFEMSMARRIIREQVNGTYKVEDLPSIRHQVWTHVDRIYRGGRGDDAEARQAIFTKDIVYYEGYKLMSRFIAEKRAAGVPIAEIYDYLSQGKFDPTNKDHLAYMAEKGLKVL